jgi:hypothetical protein
MREAMRYAVLTALLVAAAAACFCSRCKRNSSVPRETKQADPAGLESVLIEDMPHVKQKPDFCGEACAEMVLKKLGKDMDQDYVFNRSGLDPGKGRGCHAAELEAALGGIGFKVGEVWKSLDSDYTVDDVFGELLEDLGSGVPSIVCMNTSDDEDSTEHFRLVLGYDAEKDEIVFHEPAEDDGAYRRMDRKLFLSLWPLEGSKGRTVIRFAMEPGSIEEKKPFAGHTDADYAQHVIGLKQSLPPGFTLMLQKPFVVIGDETPDMVEKRAVGTVKWAVDMMKQDFFTKDPDDIIDIWLFKDRDSYEKHAKLLFNHEPDTPYGYYSETHKALVMNIATGGGTLVHEIVHPFMRANFPACPPWLNEGLGSLYEQCMESLGHIRGLTNWRLPGLQKTIKKGGLQSFKTLTDMDENAFYDDEGGTNYAQSRYLLYYLQEKGLLVTYYHKFYKNRKTDPTGFETLKKVLGEKDMKAFQETWEAWVLTLVFE